MNNFNNNKNVTPSSTRTKVVAGGFSSKPNGSNFRQPIAAAAAAATPNTKKNFNDIKRVSRTVGCARTAIRRSIHTLNNVNLPDTEFKTPSSSKTTFRRSTFRKNLVASGSRIPMLTGALRQYPNTDEKCSIDRVHKDDALFKRRRRSNSRRSSGLSGLETGCLILTPHLMRQLLKASASKGFTGIKRGAGDQTDESILEEEEEEANVEIKTIKPSSLLKILLSESADNNNNTNNNNNNKKEAKFDEKSKVSQASLKENLLRKSLSNPLRPIEEENSSTEFISNSSCKIQTPLNEEMSKNTEKKQTSDMSSVTIRKVLDLVPTVKTALKEVTEEEETSKLKSPLVIEAQMVPLVVSSENQLVPIVAVVTEEPVVELKIQEQVAAAPVVSKRVSICEDEFAKGIEKLNIQNEQIVELSPKEDDQEDKIEYIQMTSISTDCSDIENLNKSPEIVVVIAESEPAVLAATPLVVVASAISKNLIEEIKENEENQNPTSAANTPKKRGRPPKIGTNKTAEKTSTAKKPTKTPLKEIVKINEVAAAAESIKKPPATRSKLESKFNDLSNKVVAKELRIDQETNEASKILTQKVLTRAQRAKLAK
jgi:hypothetical protein